MGKRRRSGETPPAEVIHYRPGGLLGRLLTRFADEHGISRASAARRLACLAARGLDADAYSEVEELSGYAGCDFDSAAQLVHVAVATENSERAKAKKPPLDAAERRAAVSFVLAQHRAAFYATQYEREQEEEKKEARVRNVEKY